MTASVTFLRQAGGMGEPPSPLAPSAPSAEWLSGFDGLCKRLRPSLVRFFARRVGSAAVAEELVQELFLRLLRRADLFELQNLDGYVFEAAANLARDRARREAARRSGQHVDVADLQLASEEPSPEQVVDDRRRLERLMAAMRRLPRRTRTVLVLSRFEGLTHAQIAARLGVTVSAVEKQVAKALLLLQERAQ